MIQRLLRTLSPAIALATVLSCAGGGYAPQSPSMPAARAALRPEHRLFFDALVDYGDWVLIEPYGFVFRPKVDFATFRPYSEGFWAPSDSWGWIWISAEPFGWATYHYGDWAYDRYQGWVWIPDVHWAPAWVSWQIAGNYTGWAPRGPQGGLNPGAPGGPYVYVPLSSMGATDLKLHVATRDKLGAQVAQAQPLTDMVERDGVRVAAGPSFARVEQARGGTLRRVEMQGTPVSAETAKTPAPSAIEATRREGEQVAQTARALTERRGGSAPAVVRVVRPAWVGSTTPPDSFRKAKARRAPADTTR